MVMHSIKKYCVSIPTLYTRLNDDLNFCIIMSIQYTKHPPQYVAQHFLHFIILPAILIGSDLLIGLYGYYMGSTGDTWSLVHFVEVLVVALVVIIIVEVIKRLDNDPNINPHIQHALHLIVLPAVLIGSDILIGFFGHFRGSTSKNIWSVDVLLEYIQTLTLTDLAFLVGFALVIVFIVEIITRLDE